MMVLDDYQLIRPLNYDLGPHVSSHKVKEMLSNDKIYNLYTFDLASLEKSESLTIRCQDFVQIIQQRVQSLHPNLLKINEFFVNEDTNQISIVMEHCLNGNLTEFIENCNKKGKHLREELIFRILYQVLCALKTIEYFTGKLSLNEIFLDEEFNVKFFNLYIGSRKGASKFKSVKVCHLGMLLYTLCTLKPFDKDDIKDIKHLHLHYSTNLLILLNTMLKDSSYLYKQIDKILCNPTILLKSSQWTKDRPFYIVTSSETLPQSISGDSEVSEIYSQKLQYLKIKETALQAKEDKLNERERLLLKREKKIILMEKLAREKLTRAEIYLKTNRESRYKSNFEVDKNNLDTSFSADCGDSVVVPTSKKLDARTLVKPAAFTRSKSERRVKFKGHSPLKEINFNKRRSFNSNCSNYCMKSGLPLIDQIPEELDCRKENIGSEKLSSGASSSLSGGSGRNSRSNKKLFVGSAEINEMLPLEERNGNGVGILKSAQCRPISWTEESKRHAFDLLRIMNSAIDRDVVGNNEIKHTFL